MLKIEDNNIYLTRGDTATLLLTITKEDGSEYIPQAGDTVTLTIKRNFDNAQPVFIKDFTIGDELSLSIGEELNSCGFGIYDYDIRLSNDTTRDTFICCGKFEIGRGSY